MSTDESAMTQMTSAPSRIGIVIQRTRTGWTRVPGGEAVDTDAHGGRRSDAGADRKSVV